MAAVERGTQAGPSTSQRAEDPAQQRTQQAKETAQQKVQEATGEARGRLREQVDQRSTQAGEQVRSTAGDLRTVAEQLREQGKEGPAKLAEQAAERTDRLGGYLHESDADRILGDLEEFARTNTLGRRCRRPSARLRCVAVPQGIECRAVPSRWRTLSSRRSGRSARARGRSRT